MIVKLHYENYVNVQNVLNVNVARQIYFELPRLCIM
jgi:hypothetical protein